MCERAWCAAACVGNHSRTETPRQYPLELQKVAAAAAVAVAADIAGGVDNGESDTVVGAVGVVGVVGVAAAAAAVEEGPGVVGMIGLGMRERTRRMRCCSVSVWRVMLWRQWCLH